MNNGIRFWLSSIRSGSVVKGQYAGCAASGQPLTEALRKDPVCRVVAVCYRSCLPAREMIWFLFGKLVSGASGCLVNRIRNGLSQL